MWEKKQISDEALIAAFTKGDKTAFDELYSRFSPMLRNFAKGMTKDRAAAEDIVQNIFMKMYLTAPTFDSVTSLKNWLYVCVRNEVLSYLNSKWERSVGKMSEISTQPIDPTAEQTEEREAVAVKAADLHSALDSMPERRADVFRLSKIEKMPNSEIARRMGISERTVEKHIQLAYKELRQKLN